MEKQLLFYIVNCGNNPLKGDLGKSDSHYKALFQTGLYLLDLLPNNDLHILLSHTCAGVPVFPAFSQLLGSFTELFNVYRTLLGGMFF